MLRDWNLPYLIHENITLVPRNCLWGILCSLKYERLMYPQSAAQASDRLMDRVMRAKM
jgi:hypothetical protein